MTEKRIKTYEKLLGYILILAVILGIVSQLTGCGEYFKEESRIVIDYRFAEGHTEIWTMDTQRDIGRSAQDLSIRMPERSLGR